ncbi:MAG: helix-turn-helix domain-containing protein [Pseudonocardiaceae bacterium]
MDSAQAQAIGARARMIRRRRGLSQEVVAGLAGITKTYLSMLELGQRGFNRRGLIENLADALGASVADLTGQPYPAPDRATLQGRAALPGISLALHDVGPDEIPDLTPRGLEELVTWANSANEHRDQGRFSLAGRDLGTLMTALHAHALTAARADRDRAFTALVQSCIVAGDVAFRLAGNGDLSISASARGYDMAVRHGDPGLIGCARWIWAIRLVEFGARGRASRVLTAGIDELGRSAHLRDGDTFPAEMLGFAHLVQAQFAARDKQNDDAYANLAEAEGIAARIGECNGNLQHFGPTNVAVWRLAMGIELGEGGRAYEVATRKPLDVAALHTTSDPRHCISILLGRWCRTGRTGTRRRSGIWTPLIASRRPGFATTRSPGTSSSRWTAVPRAECGSWTACGTVFGSVAGAAALGRCGGGKMGRVRPGRRCICDACELVESVWRSGPPTGTVDCCREHADQTLWPCGPSGRA